MADPNIALISLTTAGMSAVATIATLGWWLRGQFSDVRSLIHFKIDEHSRADTLAFEELRMRTTRLEMLLDPGGRNVMRGFDVANPPKS